MGRKENPHEGWAALVLNRYRRRRARVTRRQAGVLAATASIAPGGDGHQVPGPGRDRARGFVASAGGVTVVSKGPGVPAATARVR
jgi:hypothetical protein